MKNAIAIIALALICSLLLFGCAAQQPPPTGQNNGGSIAKKESPQTADKTLDTAEGNSEIDAAISDLNEAENDSYPQELNSSEQDSDLGSAINELDGLNGS